MPSKRIPKIVRIIRKYEPISKKDLAIKMGKPPSDIYRCVSMARAQGFTIYTTPNGYRITAPTNPEDYIYEANFRLKNAAGTIRNGVNCFKRGLILAEQEMQKLIKDYGVEIKKCQLIIETIADNGEKGEQRFNLLLK